MVGLVDHGRALYHRGRARLLRRQRSLAAERARGVPPAAGAALHRHAARTAAGRIRPYIHPYDAEARPADAGGDLRRGPTNARSICSSSAEGYEYSVLGLFTTNVAPLRVRRTSASRCSSSAPTGSGRCVYSRIMQGAQISLSVGLVGVFLSLTPRRAARRHFRLLRRADRLRHPARHRVRAVAADDPDLARRWPRRCRRTGRPTLNYFMITRDPVADRLGAARPRRARPLPERCARRSSSPRPGSTACRRGASSSATCCRASPATSSPR